MIKVSLKVPKNSQENTCIGVNKVAGLRLATLLAQKETSTQALSCGFWEMIKNTFLQNSSRWLLLNRPVLCYLLRGGSFPWTTLSLFSAIVFSIKKNYLIRDKYEQKLTKVMLNLSWQEAVYRDGCVKSKWCLYSPGLRHKSFSQGFWSLIKILSILAEKYINLVHLLFLFLKSGTLSF